MQNMTGSTGDSFNFSDSDLGAVLQPAMFWFAQRTGQASLLWSEREHMLKLRANVREDNRLLPLTLIWGGEDRSPQHLSATEQDMGGPRQDACGADANFLDG